MKGSGLQMIVTTYLDNMFGKVHCNNYLPELIEVRYYYGIEIVSMCAVVVSG